MGGFNSMQPEIIDLRLTKMIHQEFWKLGLILGRIIQTSHYRTSFLLHECY